MPHRRPPPTVGLGQLGLLGEQGGWPGPGPDPGPEASMLKVYISELLQRVVQFSVDVAAEQGGQAGDVDFGGWTTDVYWPYMMARPVTIYAGCNEVQRDILAKSVLQLGASR